VERISALCHQPVTIKRGSAIYPPNPTYPTTTTIYPPAELLPTTTVQRTSDTKHRNRIPIHTPTPTTILLPTEESIWTTGPSQTITQYEKPIPKQTTQQNTTTRCTTSSRSAILPKNAVQRTLPSVLRWTATRCWQLPTNESDKPTPKPLPSTKPGQICAKAELLTTGP
jgi:hypothetical protein